MAEDFLPKKRRSRSRVRSTLVGAGVRPAFLSTDWNMDKSSRGGRIPGGQHNHVQKRGLLQEAHGAVFAVEAPRSTMIPAFVRAWTPDARCPIRSPRLEPRLQPRCRSGASATRRGPEFVQLIHC